MTRADWLYLAGMFVCTRLVIFFLGLIGTAFVPQLQPDGTFALRPLTPGADLWSRIFSHFDSGFYLAISHGYALPGSSQDWLKQWAYFPLYPIVLHPVSVVFHLLGVPGDSDVLSGVLVSNLALFAALVYLFRLASAELSVAAAQRAVAYLLVFPTTFYFSAVYPESLYLLLSLAGFYHARRREWAATGILGALALLTRPQGLFLLVPLGLEFVAWWVTRRETRSLLRGLWLGMPLVALAGYALYSRAVTGYWLAFSTSASQAWGKRLTPPIYPLIRYLLAPDLGNAFSFDFRAVNFAVAVVFLALVIVAWRRLPPAYSVWLFLCVLFPLSTNGHYFFSLARYVSTAFPAFLALAAWSLGERWTPNGSVTQRLTAGALQLRDRLVLIPSLALVPLYVVMFVNGISAAI